MNPTARSTQERSVTKVLPDDHSKLAPLLPIPNRTVKRLRADDSADSRVKVGHRQALTALKQPSPSPPEWLGFFFGHSNTCCLIFTPGFLQMNNPHLIEACLKGVDAFSVYGKRGKYL